MFKVQKEKIKKVSIIIAAILLIVVGLTMIVRADDKKEYVLSVVDAKEGATGISSDGDLEIHKQIMKVNDQVPYYDSKQLSVRITAKDINEVKKPQVALVIDSSYSVQTNDAGGTLKANAISLVNSIYPNCPSIQLRVYNGNSTPKTGWLGYNASNLTTIRNAINGLTIGDGNDLREGIQAAANSFTANTNQNDNYEHYIIILTDSTDNTKDLLSTINANDIKIVAISVEDIMSSSYYENGSATYGRVQMIYSEDRTETKTYEEFDPKIITDFINVALTNVNITDIFSDAILNCFDLTLNTTSLPAGQTVQLTNNGYAWNIDEIKRGETKTLTFNLKLKDNLDIQTGSEYLYRNIYLSDRITANYKTNRHASETADLAWPEFEPWTIAKEKTPAIQIRSKYTVTIKAVNEENMDNALQGIDFKITGVDESGDVIYSKTQTTDRNGCVVVDNLTTTGKVTFTLVPIINKVGYSATDTAIVEIYSNNYGADLEVLTEDWKGSDRSVIDNANRDIMLIFPISTEKFTLNVKLSEANNENVPLEDCEFRLIYPKRNSTREYLAVEGKTDKNGLLVFNPSIMTVAGTYEYILVQKTTQDGYEVIDNVTARITFDNRGSIVRDGIQVVGNEHVVGRWNKFDEVTINVSNASETENTFGLELTLLDQENDKIAIENATYDIYVTRTSNGKIITNHYPNFVTNEYGKINAQLPGSGNITLKIVEKSSKVGYESDADDMIITIERVNGVVSSIQNSYYAKEDGTINSERGRVDAQANSTLNKLIVNCTNRLQAERNMIKIKLVDNDETDYALPYVDYQLIDQFDPSKVYTGTSDGNGIAEIQLPSTYTGIIPFEIKVASGVPNYYKSVVNSCISIGFNSNGIINQITNTWNTPGVEDPIVEISDLTVDNTSDPQYTDHTATVTIGTSTKAGSSYKLKIALTGTEQVLVSTNPEVWKTQNTGALEGAAYDITIRSRDDRFPEKTIKGRKTDAQGFIETNLILDTYTEIEITQVGSVSKYKIDESTKTFTVVYNEITGLLSKDASTDPEVIDNTSRVVLFNHTNAHKTNEDVLLNFTVAKEFANDGSGATQLPLHIYQKAGDATVYTNKSKLVSGEKINSDALQADEIEDSNDPLNLLVYTSNNADVALEHLKIKGIEKDEERTADIIVEEIEITGTNALGEVTWTPKASSAVLYRLVWRYNQNKELVEFTNIEITQGIRLLKEGTKSFFNVETDEGMLTNINTTLYSSVEFTGNLVIDINEQDQIGNLLPGATYDIAIKQPNNIGNRVYRKVLISNGNDASAVELPGLLAQTNTEIILTPVDAPIGYSVDPEANTQTLKVTTIEDSGEVQLRLEPSADDRLEARLTKVAVPSGTDGTTEYKLVLINKEVNTFTVKVKAIDAATKQPVEGFSFNIDSIPVGAYGSYHGTTDATDSDGYAKAIVGPNFRDTEGDIVYTISKDTTADYYQHIPDSLKMTVRFNQNREVTESTKTLQTQSNYGELDNGGKWYITEVAQKDYDVLVEIYVDKQDPLQIEMNTIDRVTGVDVLEPEYKMTPSLEDPNGAISTINEITKKAELRVKYPNEGKTVTYKIENTSINDSYEVLKDQEIVVTYDANGNIVNDRTKTYIKDQDELQTYTIDYDSISGKFMRITAKANPRILVKVTTKDYITHEVIATDLTYEITDPTGYKSSESIAPAETVIEIENGFIKPGMTGLQYTIKQTQVPNNYESAGEKQFKLNFGDNGRIVSGAPVDPNDDHIELYDATQNEISIIIYDEPRQGIVIENYDYYTNEHISGGVFTFESSLDTERTATLNVGADGIGTTLGSRLGLPNSNVTYTVKQTGSDPEYAKLKDFAIRVHYNSQRQIDNVEVVNHDNDKWLRPVDVIFITPSSSTDKGYNGNDKGIVKLIIRSNYAFRINVTNVDRFDESLPIANTQYSAESTIPTTGPATKTNMEGKATIYVDRVEEGQRVVYSVKEDAPADDYQAYESETIDIEVTFDDDGFITLGSTRIVTGKGDDYAVVSDVTRTGASEKEKFTIDLKVTSIPKFRVNITNLDRDDRSPIAETQYSITADNDGSSMETFPTDAQGKTVSRVTGSTVNREVIYTVHEDRSSNDYQNLEQDIKVRVRFTPDGEVDTLEILEDGYKYASASKAVGFTTFDKVAIDLEITNNPAFNINILNTDRSTNDPLAETKYTITKDDDEAIELDNTDATGITNYKQKYVDKDTECIYTIHEEVAPDKHQAQEQDIKVKVKFDSDGYIENAQVIQGSDFALLTKDENPENSQEKFKLHLNIINNKFVDIKVFSFYKAESQDPNTMEVTETLNGIGGTEYTIAATINESTTSVEDSQNQATGIDGITNFEMTKGLSNKTIRYTIKETYNIRGFEKVEDDIVLLVTYDSEGKIVDTMTSVAPENIASISIDVTNFIINVNIESQPTKNFNISVSATDLYDSGRSIDGVEIEAFLVKELTSRDPVYKFENKVEGLKTGKMYYADENGNFVSEDNPTQGECYAELNVQYEKTNSLHRQFVLEVKNTPDGYQSFKDYGLSENGSSLLILVDVEFSDVDGRVLSTKCYYRDPDKYNFTWGRWYAPQNLVDVHPNGYGIRVNLHLNPVLRLSLHAQDLYESNKELDTAKLKLSTSSYPVGQLGTEDVIQQGFVGWRPGERSYYSAGDRPYGTKFDQEYTGVDPETGDPIFVNFARTETEHNKVRVFYLYEEKEPTYDGMEYQRFRPQDPIHYYSDRLIAKILVRYDDVGRILNAEVADIEWRSSNTFKTNYIETRVNNEENKLEVIVTYQKTTYVQVHVKDEVSNADLSGVRITPFLDGVKRYEYSSAGYETTNSYGKADWHYWDGNFASQDRVFRWEVSYQSSGFDGYFNIGELKLRVSYYDNGTISAVKVLEYDKNAISYKIKNEKQFKSKNVTTIDLEISVKRKFIMYLDFADMYDASKDGELTGTFSIDTNVVSDTHLQDVAPRKRVEVGQIYPNEEVTYHIKETGTGSQRSDYEILPDLYVKVRFNSDGSIDGQPKCYIKVNDQDVEVTDYYEFEEKAKVESGKKDRNTIDLKIKLKKYPRLKTVITLSDKFYPSVKLSDGQFSIVNSYGETINNGDVYTDETGKAIAFVGRIRPNEIMTYTLNQKNTIQGYLQSSPNLVFEVEYNETGYIKNYTITNSGAKNELVIDPETIPNTRTILLNQRNVPTKVYAGIINIDQSTGEGINDVQYTITPEENQVLGDAITLKTQEYGSDNGRAVKIIDDVTETANTSDLRAVTYHVSQVESTRPRSYRGVDDFDFTIYYNADGSISYADTNPNNDGRVKIKVYAAGTTQTEINDIPVQVLITIENTNTYDLIIKDEDINTANLGINGTKYDVTIKGVNKGPVTTEDDGTGNKGIARVYNQRDNGQFEINISEIEAGSGYRTNLLNKAILTVIKGTDDYTIDFVDTQSESVIFRDSKHVSIPIDEEAGYYAEAEIDEAKGTITITFKNDTMHELGILKYDINTYDPIQGAKFTIKRQEIDGSGDNIGDAQILRKENGKVVLGEIVTEQDGTGEQLVDGEGNPVFDMYDNPVMDGTGEIVEVITDAEKFESDADGIIHFDLGSTKDLKNRKFKYIIEEVQAPEGYKMLANNDRIIRVYAEFDQNGQLLDLAEHTSSWRAIPSKYEEYENGKTRENKNGILLRISNGDLNGELEPYTIKIVSEDSITGKRVNENEFNITITQIENGIQNQIANDTALTGNITQGKFLLEKGAIVYRNLTDSGMIEIDVDQTANTAPGYDLSDKHSGTIKLNIDYQETGTGKKDRVVEVLNSGDFVVGEDLIVDEITGEIIIKVKSVAVVELGVHTEYTYYVIDQNYFTHKERANLPGATYVVTGEMQTQNRLVTIDDLEVPSTFTGQNGNVRIKLGRSYPGKTVIYTIKGEMPEGYQAIDDIRVLVKFDSDGNVKYSEMLSSEDIAEVTEGLVLSSSVDNEGNVVDTCDEKTPKEFDIKVTTAENERVDPYKFRIRLNTDEDEDSRETLQGATYQIIVEEEYGQSREWIATTEMTYDAQGNPLTDEKGHIIYEIVTPEFTGYGRVQVLLTQLEAPNGYARKEKTEYFAAVRNKIYKSWEGLQSGSQVITQHGEPIEMDSVFSNTKDPFNVILNTTGYLKADRFNLTLNKLDQKTGHIIAENPAQFELYYNEKVVTYNDVQVDTTTPQTEVVEGEEGVISQDDVTVEEIEKTITHDLGLETTGASGKATFMGIQMPEEAGTYEYEIAEVQAPTGYVAYKQNYKILVTFERNSEGNLIIKNVAKGQMSDRISPNIDIVKTNSKQLVVANIRNVREEDAIQEGQYSLNITNVDSTTLIPIEEEALFKVKIPDENALEGYTDVYTETAGISYLENGKLEYCYIEQGKNYVARLTHMDVPTLPTTDGSYETTIEYVFTEKKAADGYALIDEELVLSITFEMDPTTNVVTIKNAETNYPDVLVIKNKSFPISVDTELDIDIMNEVGGSTSSTFKVRYYPNEGDDGIPVENMPATGTKLIGQPYTIASEIPTKEGFEFAGWARTQTGDVEFMPGDIYNEDKAMSLFAVWQTEAELYIKSSVYVIGNADNYKDNKSLEENVYEDGDLYIMGILPSIKTEDISKINENNQGTNLEEFIKNIQTNAVDIKVYNTDGDDITETLKYIGTDMIIEFTKGTQTIRLTAIVKSDINGNGIIDLADISKGNKFNKEEDFSVFGTEAKKIAYDVNLDGKYNLKDIQSIKRAYNREDNTELN